MVPDSDSTTIHDWLFDVSSDKWVLWESRVDDSPIDKVPRRLIFLLGFCTEPELDLSIGCFFTKF
jgi:hypothetical protein